MEIQSAEVLAIEKLINEKHEAELVALVDLELVMVGGGVGDILLG